MLNEYSVDDFDETVIYGNGSTNRVFRIREGIERFMITDINNPGRSALAQSDLHVMWDNVSTDAAGFNHVPGGANVLYLDGHVEYVRYNEKAPVHSGYAHFMRGFEAHMKTR